MRLIRVKIGIFCLRCDIALLKKTKIYFAKHCEFHRWEVSCIKIYIYVWQTNLFFPLLVVSLAVFTGYMKTGTEIPISETGLFGSQLPRAAAGEASGTPPASQTHAREARSECCNKIKTFPSQPCTPLIKRVAKRSVLLCHPLSKINTQIFVKWPVYEVFFLKEKSCFYPPPTEEYSFVIKPLGKQLCPCCEHPKSKRTLINPKIL